MFLVRSPVAYHPVGPRWGTATLKFYEGRDILSGTSQDSLVIGLRWPDFGRTAALNVAAYYALVDGIPPGQRAYVLVGEMPETLYGSEGWGFGSLRARHP